MVTADFVRRNGGSTDGLWYALTERLADPFSIRSAVIVRMNPAGPHFASTTRTRGVKSGSGEVRDFRPLTVVRLRIVTSSVSR